MEKKIATIIKAIAFTENGGQPDVNNLKAGKSGETKSMLQFLPATWKEYSKQVSGQDNLPMTPENEAQVTYHKVEDWLNNGYTPEQIFSTWNSGRPNAYKKNLKGTNSSGVVYDTPGYVNRAMTYFNQFNNEGTKKSPEGGQITIKKPGMSAGLIPSQSEITPLKSGMIQPKMKEMKEAKQMQTPTAKTSKPI